MRTLALYSIYYIIYRVVCDSSSLTSLNNQLYHGEPKFLLSAYNQATNKAYCYVLLGLSQNTPEELSVVEDVFDGGIIVYLPLNSKKGH